MPRETGERLATYAENRVGDSLRTVVVLFEDDLEIFFVRSDLSETYTQAEFEQTATAFRTDLDWTAAGDAGAPLGDRSCLVHCFDEAYVFQFPHEDCHSILLSVDPEVGSRLSSFVEGCERTL